MTIKVEFTFGTANEAAEFFNLIADAEGGEPGNAPAKRGPGRPRKTTEPASSSAPTAGTQPTAEVVKDVAQETKVEPSVPDTKSKLTYEQTGISSKIQSAVASGKRDVAVATLRAFGVNKGTELKPEQFSEFEAALDKALAGEGDLG